MEGDAVDELIGLGPEVGVVGPPDMAFESSGAADAGEGQQALPHRA